MDTHNISHFFKGIAVFFVILCHSHQTFDLPYFTNEAFSFLQVGVQLFMLLSAYGLCFSFTPHPVGWFVFMKKRISKIAVPYWFAIALATIYRIAVAFVTKRNILQELNPLGILVNSLFLHGFSSDDVINNHIVRGGWFVGSIVIIYALFPFLHRLYFFKSKIWEKIRLLVFPLTIFVVTSILIFLLGNNEGTAPLKKVLLQLAPFSLGFSLYEYQKKNFACNTKIPLCKGFIFSVISIILFFTKTVISHFYIFTISVAFFYFFVFVLRKQSISSFTIKSSKPFLRFFMTMGKESFSIYLMQSYIAFDFCYIITGVFSRFYENDLLWFLVLQPFVIILSYFVGKIFNLVINSIVSKIKAIGKKA